MLGLWDKVTEMDGRSYLPLSPVMFDETEYLKKIDSMIKENPDLIVGLNNIAQVNWARRRLEAGDRTAFFADVFALDKCMIDESKVTIESEEIMQTKL